MIRLMWFAKNKIIKKLYDYACGMLEVILVWTRPKIDYCVKVQATSLAFWNFILVMVVEYVVYQYIFTFLPFYLISIHCKNIVKNSKSSQKIKKLI